MTPLSGTLESQVNLTLVTAPLRVLHPGKLFVTGSATATADNIAVDETLFRLGILSQLLTGTMVIFLTLALHRLFNGSTKDRQDWW